MFAVVEGEGGSLCLSCGEGLRACTRLSLHCGVSSAPAPELGSQWWWWRWGFVRKRGGGCALVIISLLPLPLSGVMIINKPFPTYCCGCKHFTRITQVLRALSYARNRGQDLQCTLHVSDLDFRRKIGLKYLDLLGIMIWDKRATDASPNLMKGLRECGPPALLPVDPPPQPCCPHGSGSLGAEGALGAYRMCTPGLFMGNLYMLLLEIKVVALSVRVWGREPTLHVLSSSVLRVIVLKQWSWGQGLSCTYCL